MLGIVDLAVQKDLVPAGQAVLADIEGFLIALIQEAGPPAQGLRGDGPADGGTGSAHGEGDRFRSLGAHPGRNAVVVVEADKVQLVHLVQGQGVGEGAHTLGQGEGELPGAEAAPQIKSFGKFAIISRSSSVPGRRPRCYCQHTTPAGRVKPIGRFFPGAGFFMQALYGSIQKMYWISARLFDMIDLSETGGTAPRILREV